MGLRRELRRVAKIYELLKPLIAQQDADFVAKVDGNFAAVDDVLAKYQDGEGYVSYEKLSEADRNLLSSKVNTLAEDLSTLRGKLGLG